MTQRLYLLLAAHSLSCLTGVTTSLRCWTAWQRQWKRRQQHGRSRRHVQPATGACPWQVVHPRHPAKAAAPPVSRVRCLQRPRCASPLQPVPAAAAAALPARPGARVCRARLQRVPARPPGAQEAHQPLCPCAVSATAAFGSAKASVSSGMCPGLREMSKAAFCGVTHDVLRHAVKDLT